MLNFLLIYLIERRLRGLDRHKDKYLGQLPWDYDRIKSNKTGDVRTMQHFGAFVQPLLQYKTNKYYIFWVCICGLSYPACNAHESYCHLWPVRPKIIFPLCLINCTIVGKKLLNKTCVLIFSQILSENSLFKKNWGDIIINVLRSSCKIRVIFVRVNGA
jgi:hypothetical protein